MLDPIKKIIEVPCDQEKAFTVFVNQVDTWWPKDKNSVSAMNGEVARQIVIEPKLGGKVFEVGHDDTNHTWGSVTLYNPYEQFAMDWHIGLPAESASAVTVQFVSVDKNTTRVELTHSRWEAFGDKATDMRAGYDQGWVGVFEQAYRNACSDNS